MSDHVMYPLDDAMPGRQIIARWVVRGTLTLETAMHLGGSEGSERVDAPVLRDARSGRPLLPGTTLAGALRSALADRILGYAPIPSDAKERIEVTRLFGGTRGDDDGSQSPLIVFDALGTLSPAGVEIRDGVAIAPATGTAEDHKKYDYEVLPAGTTFGIRVDLLVVAKADKEKGSVEDEALSEEKAMLEALAAALDAFSHGDNGLGARRSRGLGRVSATWSARRFELNSLDGWLRWLETDHDDPIPVSPSESCIRAVLERAALPASRPLALVEDKREWVELDLDLELVGDILVRSPGTEAGAPDVSHLTSGGEPILPGTSLAGALRAQALRIARLVHDRNAEEWINRLFGPRFEGKRPQPGDKKPRASRLRITEAKLESTTPRRQTRVAIDRFTQGTVDGALFEEQTQAGGHTRVRLELRTPQPGEFGLVLLVVKDLLGGVLPVGGTSSVGRGFVTGTAAVTFHGLGAPRSVKLEPGKAPAGEGASEIDRAIREFQDSSVLPRASHVPVTREQGDDE